jgi:hypothetical protein
MATACERASAAGGLLVTTTTGGNNARAADVQNFSQVPALVLLDAIVIKSFFSTTGSTEQRFLGP